jgi:hypothetical protein
MVECNFKIMDICALHDDVEECAEDSCIFQKMLKAVERR